MRMASALSVALSQLPAAASSSALTAPLHGPQAPNVPRWSTIYDLDTETNGTGTTGFTNLLWGANLTELGVAC
eukprot:SAG22_NODE_5918_length_931_cov_1.319712_2_plen_72_part_01